MFLKLTRVTDPPISVYINMEHVSCFCPNPNVNGADLFDANESEYPWTVQETPQEIQAMILSMHVWMRNNSGLT